MNDNSLVAFVLVARTRSFTEAARQLGLSASALGKTIARLEAQFGVRLFNRSTRSVALTAEGALFLERAQRILAEYEAAHAELSQAAAAPSGRLRVSLPLVGVVDDDLLAAFAAAYPQIVLDLDFSDRLVDVIQEGFDVVVRTGEAGDSGLSTRTLTSFRHAVVASPGYLAAHGAPQAPGDLTDRNCLLYRFPSTGQVETWPLEGAPASLTAAAVSNSIRALIALARAGQGLACLPTFSVRSAIAAGELVEVLGEHLGPPRAFRLLWPSGRRAPPKVRAFIDFVTASVSGPAA